MIWKREPALFYGLVNAVIALVVSFGLDLTVDQIGAIMAVTSATLALVTRRQINRPATGSAIVEEYEGP